MALARLTSSCQEGNMEQAISACEDLVHDARRILAGLYERDLDASSPSEDSHGDADGNAGDGTSATRRKRGSERDAAVCGITNRGRR